MKRRVWLTLIVGLAAIGWLPSSGWAAGKFGHQQEAFTQCLLRVGGEGDLELSRVQTKFVYETHVREMAVPVEVEENGKKVTKMETQQQPYTTMRSVSAMELVKLDPESVDFFDIKGTELPVATVKAGLQKPKLILVSKDGKIHPSFATLFKASTIVMSAPPEPEPVPEVAPAPPPPADGNAPPPPPAASRLRARPLSVQVVGQETPVPNENQPPQPVQKIDFGLSTNPAPTFKYCKLNEANGVSVRSFTESKFSITAYKDVQRDGVTKKVPYSIMKTVTSDVTDFWDRTEVKFLGTDGKPLNDSRLVPFRQREAAVVVSGNDAAVDPFWLQNIIPTSVVLIMPPAFSGHGHGPTPLPLPVPDSAPPPPPAAVPPNAST